MALCNRIKPPHLMANSKPKTFHMRVGSKIINFMGLENKKVKIIPLKANIKMGKKSMVL